MHPEPVPEAIRALERPDRALFTYYLISAFLSGPLIFFILPYLYFRFHTLRYRFDAEGIHMKVGLLFRREINLTYARIQDIHLRSGVIQRWLGLANVDIQTASGSTGAELVIEGFKNYEAIRDFLYTRMRGYQSQREMAKTAARLPPESSGKRDSLVDATAGPVLEQKPEMISLLEGIRDELRRTREIIAREKTGSPTPPSLPNV
jgi:putative membrane protein